MVKVFSHGQLYVGCSQVGNPTNLKVAVMQCEGKNQQIVSANNVVLGPFGKNN